jgi:hypothetical protein
MWLSAFGIDEKRWDLKSPDLASSRFVHITPFKANRIRPITHLPEAGLVLSDLPSLTGPTVPSRAITGPVGY